MARFIVMGPNCGFASIARVEGSPAAGDAFAASACIQFGVGELYYRKGEMVSDDETSFL